VFFVKKPPEKERIMNIKKELTVATMKKEATCANFKIYHQSTFERWDIADESIQAIITSPPYFRKRFYDIPDIVIGGNSNCEHEFQTGKGKWTIQIGNPNFNRYGEFCKKCGAWKGQYGWEPNPELFITHTRMWVQEAKRVLCKDGVLFLNLGDSYSNKAKILIPERIAIALIDDGWILRNSIVWFKKNSVPESTKDRFAKKYENIFMFVKSKKYHFDLDAVREPHKPESLERVKHGWNGHREPFSALFSMDMKKMCHPLGKNPGDVWAINNQPSKEEHFAMFPEKLAERMILCSTKPGDTVLDTFAGGATTILVAYRLGRKAYGIDLGYKDVQKSRLSKISTQYSKAKT
jgi:DNA modification methylase